MNASETRSAVAHLVRRTAFGATADEIDALAALGYEGAVDRLCDLSIADEAADAIAPPVFAASDPLASPDADSPGADDRRRARQRAQEERRQLIAWSLQRMVAAERPVREWLTFAWHDHFATSLQKVKQAELMHRQYVTLAEAGRGRFDDLVAAVARDPAMLIWLDGRRNTAQAPNENFARELLELFTLGHGAGHHTQPYTETDVAEAARALTGWAIDRRTGAGRFVARRHDGGAKTVLGVAGNLGLDDVVDAAVHHPACAPHVVSQLWSRMARPAGPDDPVVVRLAVSFAEDLDIPALLRRMCLEPDFLAQPTRSGLLKSPVQFVVGTARALHVGLDQRLLAGLRSLGQLPFLPPDVGGWPANEAWLSTSTARIRVQLALDLAGAATPSVETITVTARSERAGQAARLLGVDGWSAATRSALDQATDPQQLLALAIASPEHLAA